VVKPSFYGGSYDYIYGIVLVDLTLRSQTVDDVLGIGFIDTAEIGGDNELAFLSNVEKMIWGANDQEFYYAAQSRILSESQMRKIRYDADLRASKGIYWSLVGARINGRGDYTDATDPRLDMGAWWKGTSGGQTNVGFAPRALSNTPPTITAVSPTSGETDVPSNSEIEFTIEDNVGIDLSSAVVEIDAGSGFETVYTSSAFQTGFAGSVTIESAVLYRFRFTRDAKFPSLQVVTVRVTVEDDVGAQTIDSYAFTSEELSVVSIDNVFVVSRDVIKINLSGSLSVAYGYFDTNSYAVTPLSILDSVLVQEVLPVQGVSSDAVFLKVRGLILGERYSVTLSGDLFDITGLPFTEDAVTFTVRRTKMDTAVDSMARMYNVRRRGNIRGVLEALMISDEEIGGDF
jgi:hypothetical protein